MIGNHQQFGRLGLPDGLKDAIGEVRTTKDEENDRSVKHGSGHYDQNQAFWS
jgi:hypothetical protein